MGFGKFCLDIVLGLCYKKNRFQIIVTKNITK